MNFTLLRIFLLIAFSLVSITSFAEDNFTAPQSPLTVGLSEALKDYEALAKAGEWPKIPKGPKLEVGGSDPARVPLLRQRLKAEHLWSGPLDSDVLDEDLAGGLKKFQALNGLEEDGIPGPTTTLALNIEPAERVCQIQQNMARLAELHARLEDTYLLVNIPEFRLHIVKDGKEINTINVVDGRPDRKTPLMDNAVQTIIFNPAWHVPFSIAVKDKLAKIRKDPSFLAKNNMHLLARNAEGVVGEVDPAGVDWSAVTKRNFNYMIRQDPGDGNALGLIKFLFPNKDNVYLHDTSQRSLFAKALRPFSSGCVRLEKPLDLAEYLLKDKGWTRERIEKAMHAGHESGLALEPHMPIHIVYYTAWGTGDKSYAFRPDMYGYDKKTCE